MNERSRTLYVYQFTKHTMNKHTTEQAILREIATLNKKIDRAIIRGMSYRRDALRHRELLSVMRSMEPERAHAAATRHARPVRSSPVRRSLVGSVAQRMFSFRFGV